jgi:hypothetical protein
VQAPMIDQVLKEIGIEGGSLARMGGLMREASDMQRVAKDAGGGSPRGEAPRSEAPKLDGASPRGAGGDRAAPPSDKA